MLEGLEISEKRLLEIKTDNPTYRIDSEFFKKEYIRILERLKRKRTEKLETICSWITQGPNPSFSDDGNIPCLTGRNINKGRVDYNNSDLIHEDEYDNLKRFQLIKGDTLITLKGKGSIGKIGYVTKNLRSVFSRDIGVIRPSKNNHSFINAYILSFYGKKVIERGETGGTGQSTLTSAYLKNIDIPRFDIENKVGELVELSEKTNDDSKEKYKQAESLLLETLGLKGFKPSTEPTNIKSFKESFGQYGRLDAEYYQKKYEQVIDKIKSVNHASIGELTLIKKSIEPGSSAYSEEGFPFLRVADYNKFGFSKPQVCLSREYYEENKEKIDSLKPKKGTILFTKDGSVGNALMVKDDMDLVTSGAILHLILNDPESVLPEYLTLVLNSDLVQKQAERDAGGSIILHWRVSEIEKVIVPIIDKAKQKEISELITESFTLKKQSEQLLEAAKRAVEIAIEENEEAAMKYIEERMEEVGG